MDPSPWKGECILVPWAEVSNTSQSDLGADYQQERGRLLFPSYQLQCLSEQLLSWFHTKCQEERNCPLPSEMERSGGIFVVLVSWVGEGMREGVQGVCVWEDGWRYLWAPGAAGRQAGCSSLMSHLRTGANPLPLPPGVRWSVNDTATIRHPNFRALSHPA